MYSLSTSWTGRICLMTCILLIIPFRVVDSDNQWVFAALAFMFHGLRIFKYAILFKYNAYIISMFTLC